MGGGGCIPQRLHSCFSPSSPRFDLRHSRIFFNVAETYQQQWSEESGQNIDKVDQTHLELDGGKLALQKRFHFT